MDQRDAKEEDIEGVEQLVSKQGILLGRSNGKGMRDDVQRDKDQDQLCQYEEDPLKWRRAGGLAGSRRELRSGLL